MRKLAKANKMLELQNMNLEAYTRISKVRYENKYAARLIGNKLKSIEDCKEKIKQNSPLLAELETIHSKLKNTQGFHICYSDTLLMDIAKDTIKMDKAATISLILSMMVAGLLKPSARMHIKDIVAALSILMVSLAIPMRRVSS